MVLPMFLSRAFFNSVPGTKASFFHGRRRFNGGCTSFKRRPQVPIRGASGTGFAVADPWNTLQAGLSLYAGMMSLFKAATIDTFMWHMPQSVDLN